LGCGKDNNQVVEGGKVLTRQTVAGSQKEDAGSFQVWEHPELRGERGVAVGGGGHLGFRSKTVHEERGVGPEPQCGRNVMTWGGTNQKKAGKEKNYFRGRHRNPCNYAIDRGWCQKAWRNRGSCRRLEALQANGKEVPRRAQHDKWGRNGGFRR